MVDYDEVWQILQGEMQEGEALTTIGEIEMPMGECAPSPLVRLVVKGENGEPVVMTGDLLDKNGHFREALIRIGAGYSEFSFDCPALLVSISSEVETT